MSGTLANVIGLLAGAVWLSAALWFQLIKPEPIHPGLVAALCLVGISLTLASSAVVLTSELALLLGVVANGLFLALGGVTWVALNRLADRQAVRKGINDPSAEHG